MKNVDKVDDWQQKATFSFKDLSPLYKMHTQSQIYSQYADNA